MGVGGVGGGGGGGTPDFETVTESANMFFLHPHFGLHFANGSFQFSIDAFLFSPLSPTVRSCVANV